MSGNAIKIIVVLLIIINVNAYAEIVQRPIYDKPLVYVANQQTVAQASYRAWGKVLHLFDAPSAMCLIRTSDRSEQFFVIDMVSGYITYFGTKADRRGLRRIRFYKIFGEGKGKGDFEYSMPASITVSQHSNTCYQNLYVLDSGNNRIHKLRVDTCSKEISGEGVIFNEANNQGYGALDDPRDIDYCDLPGYKHDILIVADSGNHRLLIMKPDGTVICQIGSGKPGNGANEFFYPTNVTATRLNDENAEAFIYVVDRGNSRIVMIYQDENLNYTWLKVKEIPTDFKAEDIKYLGCVPADGLKDISLDDSGDSGVFSGIYVTNSSEGRLYHLDAFLNTIEHFNRSGRDINVCRGEIGLLDFFTIKSGLTIYENRASIYELTASPNPFNPSLEPLIVRMKICSEGDLLAYVKDQKGSIVNTLYDSIKGISPCVYAGEHYLIWDGTDSRGNYVKPGTYRIVCKVEDRYWIYSESKEIEVEIKESDE